MKEEDLKNVNPFDYGYKQDAEVTISGMVFRETLSTVMQALDQERKLYYPEHTQFVKDDEVVEEGTEGAVQLTDPIGTVDNQEPVAYYTEVGKLLLRLKLLLLEIHANNIENGVAKHGDELKKQAEMRPVK